MTENNVNDSSKSKKTKFEDFVEIEFTGKVNGEIFDSNILEDLKKLSTDAKPQKTVVIIGRKMLVPGFDKALEGKELGNKYEIHLTQDEGYGPRKKELVKTIPLHVFTKHKINPRPGATLYLDNMLVRVITISGARVITDFNNPLAGKELDYSFKITRFVTEEKEKLETFFTFFMQFKPDYEIEEKKVLIKGKEELGPFIDMFKDKFKEIFKKDLEFKFVGNEKAKTEEIKPEQNTP